VRAGLQEKRDRRLPRRVAAALTLRSRPAQFAFVSQLVHSPQACRFPTRTGESGVPAVSVDNMTVALKREVTAADACTGFKAATRRCLRSIIRARHVGGSNDGDTEMSVSGSTVADECEGDDVSAICETMALLAYAGHC
jgi:hypothetical protein